MSSNGKLNRKTFRTSREMDFFSEKELVTQTGHEKDDWFLVIPKELLDNALDAAENADTALVIDVTADANGIAIQDNGPGLPETTLEGALDFTVRVSDKEAHVSPCRGSQGNALKTLLPMPWVLDPESGRFIVEAQGKRQVLTCSVNPISQRPVIDREITEAKCKDRAGRNGTKNHGFSCGTLMRVEWAELANGRWPFGEVCYPLEENRSVGRRFRELIEGFALFNPHATIRLHWFGKTTVWKATNPQWPKWKPCHATSPHWYELPHLERLIGVYITQDREAGTERWLSDFLGEEFDGLSGPGASRSLRRCRRYSKPHSAGSGRTRRIAAASTRGRTGRRPSRIRSAPSGLRGKGWRTSWLICGRRAMSRLFLPSTQPSRASNTWTGARVL
jgi:DNA topoisomerase VI subunit B